MDNMSEWYYSLSEEERNEMREYRNSCMQKELIDDEQNWINVNKSLKENVKRFALYVASKDNFTDKDQSLLEISLCVINHCDKEIKQSEKEILLLTKYPVGSKYRPNIILMKEL